MTAIRDRSAWTDLDEARLIDALGTLDHLKGYIQAAYQRVDWGEMNKGLCIYYAQNKLAKLQGK